MSNELVPIAAMERMAQAIAKSNLFGMKDQEQALALMLVAQAEGLHPATAARDYHIIQGRPALKADAMLARYLAQGGKIEWHEHTDSKVSATFSHTAGGTLKIEWDMERAKKAGLTGKDNWTKYPRQMLRARVISEGVRATNPGVAVGVYTVEETHDFEPAPRKRKEKDMGAAEIVKDAQPEGAAVKTRADTLQELCTKSGHNYIDLLAKAEVKSADEMSDVDYDSAVRMLRRKAAASAASQG